MILIVLFLVSSVTSANELPNPIFKCCRKGEELHSNGRDCVQRPGHNIQIMGDDEVVDVRNPAEPQTPYWMPLSVMNKFPERQLFVKYNNKHLCESENFLLLNTDNADRYTITDDNTLNARFTYLDGININVEFNTHMYCLDSIAGSRGPHVFRLCGSNFDSNFTVIRKCCNFDQRIRIRNNIPTCEDFENSTWSVQNSISRSNVRSKIITDVVDDSKSLCSNGEFKISPTSDISKYFAENWEDNFYYFELKLYQCFDNFSDEFEENETIGYCYHISKSAVAHYLVFRHTPVIATLALAIGLIILGSRPDISKTVHGKALLCHILSLCIGHVFHLVWEYDTQHCENITVILLNFFMTSSELWLNAICFNMVTGLGTPLEIRKKRNRWTVFAWYSLYVWGCSLLHTVLIYTKPWQENFKLRTHLWHTKICVYPEDWINSNNLDVVFSYYGPKSILLTINVGFVTLSIFKIRKMKQDTSILQRRSSVNIINKQRTSLKYVRLLLTTGVGETAAEIAGLWVRLPSAYNPDGSRLMDDYLWSQWVLQTENTFQIVATICDLLRALSVLVLSCSTGNSLPRLRKGWRTIWGTVSARCRKQNSNIEIQFDV